LTPVATRTTALITRPPSPDLHGQSVGGDDRKRTSLAQGAVSELGHVFVEVGGDPGHLRLRQAVDVQRLEELSIRRVETPAR